MNDDKRHARLDSLLADYAYTSANDWDDYNELKRLAEIGRATEKVFKQDYPELNFGIEDEDGSGNYTIESVEQLLEWAKGVE